MAAMSDFLESLVADHLLRTTTWAKPTVLAVALCTAAPTDASTGATIVEVPNAGGYARKLHNPLNANWTDPAADGIADNLLAITFNTATANWTGSITHFAICDSATFGAGNVWIHGALTAARTVNNGDTFSFPIGDLDITFA